MCNAVQQCLAANDILLMRKGNRAFLLLAITRVKMAYRFASQGYSLKKLTRWSNDNTILLLSLVVAKYRDLIVSCRSIICWSRTAHHRQITIFCSTSSNNYCWLFVIHSKGVLHLIALIPKEMNFLVTIIFYMLEAISLVPAFWEDIKTYLTSYTEL